jgi:S-adenosylmethionine decarboxylase
MEIEFEGSEKKLEITFAKNVNLLSYPESVWLKLVKAANTQVLSKIENDCLHAFILSESSLFVWADRITMITCGTTTLAEAALFAIDYFGETNIDSFIYQRKNEYFPDKQKSCFQDDVEKISSAISGRAFRLGEAHEHHLFMFHSDKKFKPNPNDTTFEILMYDLKGKAKEVFNTQGLDINTIHEATGVHKILDGFTVDAFAFSPIGYSLNAIKGRNYYTVHVTPQDVSPYVSFETNLTSRNDIQKTLNAVLEVFRPRTFDIVYFDSVHNHQDLVTAGYERRSVVRSKIEPGYTVHFGNFSEPLQDETPALEIKFETIRNKKSDNSG